MVIATIERLADSVRNGTPPPAIPPVWSYRPGALELRDALAAAARVLAPDWAAEHSGRERLRDRMPDRHVLARAGGWPGCWPGWPTRWTWARWAAGTPSG